VHNAYSIALGVLAGILAFFFAVFGLTAIFNKIRTELFGTYLMELRKRPDVDLKATVKAFLNAPPWGFDFDKYVITKKDTHDSSHTV
jgi:hypothetical protein